MRWVIALAAALILGGTATVATAAEGEHPPHQHWEHSGIFGTFDRAALQRGFQVYNQVCAACHSMDIVSYRHLEQIGFTPEEVAAIASSKDIEDGPDDNGEMFSRPGLPKDRLAAPYPNDNAARAANGGALPPDLSVIVKARHGGEDYIYALLTGYEEPPGDVEMMGGMYYNKYYAGHQIAMPAPLAEGLVEYSDGTPATTRQMAHDVSVFLTWAAEPHLETRKRMGAQVILFLLVFTAMMYAVKRRVWADVDH